MAKRKKKAPKRGRPPGRDYPASITFVMTNPMRAEINREAKGDKMSRCAWLREMCGVTLKARVIARAMARARRRAAAK